MELTLTRLLLLTVVCAILPVSVVAANPWRTQRNRQAELEDALDFVRKHLSDKGVEIPEGRQQAKPDDFPIRQMNEGWQQTDDTQRIYVPRFNFKNQRETVDEDPVEMLINEEVTSDDIESELESEDLGQEDSIFSEGALVDDLIADIIAKEILEDLENAPVKNDQTDNTREYGFTEDESPVVSFDYDKEMENYERFMAQKMDKQDEKPYDDDILDNEITDDILNEVMMTFMENNDNAGQELETNNLITNEKEETDEIEPVLTKDEEEIIVAENILQEIEDELEREKMKQQENLQKMNQLQAQQLDTSDFCPVLGYLVDDCEIAAVDGIGGDGYRQFFELPCNWHQICYTCGNSYGISQEICDEAFYLEMLSQCGKSQTCNNRADFFLLAVSEDRIPLMTSPKVCQIKCVKDFLLGLDE